MQYIIMCGGNYPWWQSPRQLLDVNGERLVERTIRLLREAGVEDIYISSNDDRFLDCGVEVLHHTNEYNGTNGLWMECFYPTDEPTCYLFGDVLYSSNAIKIIVDYVCSDVMFFGSYPPFHKDYPKKYAEPFAFKVFDQKKFQNDIKLTYEYHAQGKFFRGPIAWELWNTICGINPLLDPCFVVINDYTCDIDNMGEIELVMSHCKE